MYFTLREEHRPRVSENRVLRTIFGPGTGQVTGEWRKLHNVELNDLYCSLNIVLFIKSRRMRWAGHVARVGDRRSTYSVSERNREGLTLIGGGRRSWKDNIKMDLQEVGWGGIDWIDVAKRRDRRRTVVNAVMNRRVP